MTTIATNRQAMVADSKVTMGNGVSYPATKIVKCKDAIVGAAGASGDCSRFIEWASAGFKGKPKFETPQGDDDSIDALILTKEGIFFYCQEYSAPEKINAEFFAIGSGGKAARLAMILGKTPQEAVELTCQVDDNSGLPLQILEL